MFHFLSSYITLCSTRHQINNGPTYPIRSQPEQVRAVCRLCVPAPCALATSLPRIVPLFFLFLLLPQPSRERDRRVSLRLSSRSFATRFLLGAHNTFSRDGCATRLKIPSVLLIRRPVERDAWTRNATARPDKPMR